MVERLKILFVCGKNMRRSPTAEKVYCKDPRLSVRSAGLSEKSRHQVSESDLQWATLVLVMERRHKSRILARFSHLQHMPRMESLEIPDEYEFMDEELIELLCGATEHYLSDFNIR